MEIETADGARVQPLLDSPETYLNRSITLYGASGSGKTIIVKHIMQLLRDSVENVLVFSPSEPTNHSYEGFVHPQFIHYRLGLEAGRRTVKPLEFLKLIVQRQKAQSDVYAVANDPRVLTGLCARLPPAAQAQLKASVKRISDKRDDVLAAAKKLCGDDRGRLAAKRAEIDEKFKTFLVLLYKDLLGANYEAAWAADLSDEERTALKYLRLNPRLLLIFDDCAPMLKGLFNSAMFRELFYVGRHYHITTVLCCQDDTDLPTNLRKNVFVSFFTTSTVFQTFFERSSGKSRFGREQIAQMAKAVFQGYRKLAYIRDDLVQFYHITCSIPEPFLFGSPAVLELCERVRSSAKGLDKDNPFYDAFAV